MDPARRRSPDGEFTRDTPVRKSQHHRHPLRSSHHIDAALQTSTAGPIGASDNLTPKHNSVHGHIDAADHRTRAAYEIFDVWTKNYGSNDPTLSQLRAFHILTGLSVEEVGIFFDNGGFEKNSHKSNDSGPWLIKQAPSSTLPSFSEFQGLVSQPIQGLPRMPGKLSSSPILAQEVVRSHRTALPDGREDGSLVPSIQQSSTGHGATYRPVTVQPSSRAVSTILNGSSQQTQMPNHAGPATHDILFNSQLIQAGTRPISIIHPVTGHSLQANAVFDTVTKKNFVTAEFLSEHHVVSSPLAERDQLGYTGFGVDLKSTRFVSLECSDQGGRIMKPQRLTFDVADDVWPEQLKAAAIHVILGSEWLKDQQTNVFSIVSGREVGEPRAKRTKFSEEERQEVAKTRKVGACEDCRRSKRKCTHVPHRENTKPSDLESTALKAVAITDKKVSYGSGEPRSPPNDNELRSTARNAGPSTPLSDGKPKEQYLPCLECEKTFPQARWREHQIRKHFPQTVWFCPESNCGFKSAIRRDNFSTHLRGEHHLPEPQVQITIKECGFETKNLFHSVCGFCGTRLNDLQESLTHILRHLTQGKTTQDWQHQCEAGHEIPVALSHENLLRNSEGSDVSPAMIEPQNVKPGNETNHDMQDDKMKDADKEDAVHHGGAGSSPERMLVSSPVIHSSENKDNGWTKAEVVAL